MLNRRNFLVTAGVVAATPSLAMTCDKMKINQAICLIDYTDNTFDELGYLKSRRMLRLKTSDGTDLLKGHPEFVKHVYLNDKGLLRVVLYAIKDKYDDFKNIFHKVEFDNEGVQLMIGDFRCVDWAVDQYDASGNVVRAFTKDDFVFER